MPRPPILTDECLAELDAKADLDAVERPPIDDGFIRDVYREMWPGNGKPAFSWNACPHKSEGALYDQWVKLP